MHLFITIPLFVFALILLAICVRDFHREGMQRILNAPVKSCRPRCRDAKHGHAR